jgi:ubiquinone biosynthesis protein COQ9
MTDLARYFPTSCLVAHAFKVNRRLRSKVSRLLDEREDMRREINEHQIHLMQALTSANNYRHRAETMARMEQDSWFLAGMYRARLEEHGLPVPVPEEVEQ